MSCATFTIGVPTPPVHPGNKVYYGDTIGTPVNNPDAEAISVGVRLYARRAVAGASDDFVASMPASIRGGPVVAPVNIIWNNQVNYSDEHPFTFSARVRCSSGREVRSANQTVFIVEI